MEQPTFPNTIYVTVTNQGTEDEFFSAYRTVNEIPDDEGLVATFELVRVNQLQHTKELV